MHMTLFTTLMIVALTGLAVENPMDYKTAYNKAQQGDKPLLILVTASWCPPCQTMKKSTIPSLIQKDAFKDFHYAAVDLDRNEKIARELIGDRGVPQLIMYEKKNDRWVRRYLRGFQTPETVEAFVAQATKFRTARAETNIDK